MIGRGSLAVIAIAIALVLPACGRVPGHPVIAIDRVDLLLDPRDTPPPGDAAGWEPERLPDFWGASRRRIATAGWYRAQVDLPRAPEGLWAVYLPRVGLNVAVYVNGEFVGDGGRFTEPIARNWNRPLLFTVPAGLLRSGRNDVLVRSVTHAQSPIVIRPFYVGPRRLIMAPYEWHYLLQVTLTQVIAGVLLVITLLVAVVYLRRDATGAFRWSVAALLLWAFSTMNSFVRDIPVPHPIWEWTQVVAIGAFVICFILSFHRQLGMHRPVLERYLVAFGVAGAIALALVPPLYFMQAVILWAAMALAMGGYLVVLIARSAGEPGDPVRRWLLLLPAAVGLLFGLHDVGSLATTRLYAGVLLSPYVAPFALLALCWLFLRNVVQALDASERLNVTLEERVHEKHAELERNYQRLRQLERERAVATERERIMRDMHDGMGGQLVSTLALVESGRGAQASVAEALRSALDDLRLMIDSLDPVEDDLVAVLATLRARLEPGLARHGVRIEWQVTDLPRMTGFGPERVLQTLRIVQEAMTNVVKHARASTIAVRTEQEADPSGRPGVLVEVSDDGRGFSPARGNGRGLANMHRRAEALGGRVTIASDGAGTRVRLWLPQLLTAT